MEKKLRCVHVTARSNFGACIRLSLSEETDDIRHLISMALMKLSNFSTDVETFHIEHINSVSYLNDMDE